MTEKRYYYLDDIEQVTGPHTLEELQTLEAEGGIFPLTRVAQEGTEDWVNFNDLHDHETRKKKKELFLQQKRNKDIEIYNLFNKGSFFALEPAERESVYHKIELLVAAFSRRSLDPEEIQFLRNWEVLESREFGEGLLIQKEMEDASGGDNGGSSSGKSNFAARMAGIMAVQGLSSLRAIEKDVDDMADFTVGED